MKSIKKFIRNTKFFELYYESAGDWRYPFMKLEWALARVLTRSRRVQFNGTTIKLPCDNWITHFRWFLFGKKEHEVVEFIDEYCSNDDVLFDVGANIGVYSIYAAKRYPSLRVICFEPEFSNLHYLKMNVFQNKLEDRVNICSVAVGDANQLSALHVQDLTPGSAVHTESTNKIDRTADGYLVVWRETIAVKTLDTLVEQLEIRPTVLKIDTDGNEFKVLSGAMQTLKTPDLHSIVIERPADNSVAASCWTLLSDLGFAVKLDRPDCPNQIWTKR